MAPSIKEKNIYGETIKLMGLYLCNPIFVTTLFYSSASKQGSSLYSTRDGSYYSVHFSQLTITFTVLSALFYCCDNAGSFVDDLNRFCF